MVFAPNVAGVTTRRRGVGGIFFDRSRNPWAYEGHDRLAGSGARNRRSRCWPVLGRPSEVEEARTAAFWATCRPSSGGGGPRTSPGAESCREVPSRGGNRSRRRSCDPASGASGSTFVIGSEAVGRTIGNPSIGPVQFTPPVLHDDSFWLLSSVCVLCLGGDLRFGFDARRGDQGKATMINTPNVCPHCGSNLVQGANLLNPRSNVVRVFRYCLYLCYEIDQPRSVSEAPVVVRA